MLRSLKLINNDTDDFLDVFYTENRMEAKIICEKCDMFHKNLRIVTRRGQVAFYPPGMNLVSIILVF